MRDMFREEFEKQLKNLLDLISRNFKMKEIKSIKIQINYLKKSIEFTDNVLEKKVHKCQNTLVKKFRVLKIYDYSDFQRNDFFKKKLCQFSLFHKL